MALEGGKFIGELSLLIEHYIQLLALLEILRKLMPFASLRTVLNRWKLRWLLTSTHHCDCFLFPFARPLRPFAHFIDDCIIFLFILHWLSILLFCNICLGALDFEQLNEVEHTLGRAPLKRVNLRILRLQWLLQDISHERTLGRWCLCTAASL